MTLLTIRNNNIYYFYLHVQVKSLFKDNDLNILDNE